MTHALSIKKIVVEFEGMQSQTYVLDRPPLDRNNTITPQPGETWLHLKSKHKVTVLHLCRMQTIQPLMDMQDAVVYYHDDNIWTRPLAEFMDGRFQRLT